MMQQSFSLVQKQRQILSQKQIFAIQLMPLSAKDLRDCILEVANENPALALDPAWKEDLPEVYLLPEKKRSIPFFFERYASSGAAAAEAADTHQRMLEQVAGSETLQDHLLSQIQLIKKSDQILAACRTIIRNLDERGFHRVPPEELPGLLDPHIRDIALHIVRSLDPEGLACSDVWESLAFQASISSRQMPLYTDKVILLYHQFLKHRRPDLLVRNLKKNGINITEKHAQMIIDFILTLNPYPAAVFGSQHRYVEPSVYVEVHDGVVSVRLGKSRLPQLSCNPDYNSQQSICSPDSADRKKIRENVTKARLFMQSLEMANNSLMQTMNAIIAHQKDFFIDPSASLQPLTQKQIALETGLSESTVSRSVSGKFLVCSRGFMKISALFSVPIQGQTRMIYSRDAVKKMIRTLIEESAVKYSDKKIADMLMANGISIARRTVTKYRAQMNLGSLYDASRR